MSTLCFYILDLEIDLDLDRFRFLRYSSSRTSDPTLDLDIKILIDRFRFYIKIVDLGYGMVKS